MEPNEFPRCGNCANGKPDVDAQRKPCILCILPGRISRQPEDWNTDIENCWKERDEK